MVANDHGFAGLLACVVQHPTSPVNIRMLVPPTSIMYHDCIDWVKQLQFTPSYESAKPKQLTTNRPVHPSLDSGDLLAI